MNHAYGSRARAGRPTSTSRTARTTASPSNSNADDGHQQYLSDAKNPYGYCNHGPNGLTCPVGIARTPEAAH
jgi:peptide-methionine (S)-S-oxide reductase